MHIRPPRLRRQPPLLLRICDQDIHRRPPRRLQRVPLRPSPRAPGALVLDRRRRGAGVLQVEDALEREEARGVVDAGGDGGNAGDGEDAGEDLGFHFVVGGEDETGAVDEADVGGEEKGLVVFCLGGG